LDKSWSAVWDGFLLVMREPQIFKLDSTDAALQIRRRTLKRAL